VLNDPELLILDEPFSGLDPINIELFKDMILEFKKKGTIIIFSTHMMEHAEFFCDSLIVLVKGKTVLEGKLSQIKKDYRKKNIKIIGKINEEELLKIKGVLKLEKSSNEYNVTIENDNIVSSVFKYVSKYNDITKFNVEEPSLNEIFIEKVGERYEK
jgi:ABC-2 type transport system ATP-binding protein